MSRSSLDQALDLIKELREEAQEDLDEAIYAFIDLRISTGKWKAEDREKHFAEMTQTIERIGRKFRYGEMH